MHGKVGVAAKAYGALHESGLATRLQPQAGKHNGTFAQRKCTFSSGPMRFANARLAIRDARAYIPTTKIHIAHADIPSTGEMLQQFIAPNTLGSDMQSSGSRSGEALGDARDCR